MSYTFAGLSNAYGAGTPTRAFTVAMVGGNPGSTVTVALDDASAGGTFFPTSLTFLTTGATSKQFVYIPAAGSTANITLTTTASGGMAGTHSIVLPKGTPTQAFNDNFTGSTGTNLNAHTADSGGTWARIAVAAGNVLLTNINTIRADTNTVEYDASPTIGSAADIDVIGIAKVFDLSTNGLVELAARMTSVLTINGYTFGFYTATYGWFAAKYTTGVGTIIFGTGAGLAILTPQPVNGGEMRMAIRQIDSSQWFFFLYDGGLIGAPVNENTNTTGKAGILAEFQAGTGADAAGQQLDRYTVENADWVPPPELFTFPNANVFQSPGIWRNSGGSAMCQTGGGYLKGKFAGSTTLKLNVDTTVNSGLTTDQMPAFRVTIDDAAAIYVQIPTGANQVTLASGLSTGTHSYRIDCLGGDVNAGDGWTGTLFQTKIDSIQLESLSTLSAPTLRTNRCMILGDSYLSAYYGGAITGAWYTYVDFSKSFGPQLAFAFDCEFGQEGIGSTGWVETGDGGFPAFPDWWDQYDSSHARTFPTLDFLWVIIGINDHSQLDADVQAAVTAWIAAARSALASTKIFVVIPPNNTKKSAISAGFTAAADANAYLIDIGSELVPAIPFTGSTWLCADGIHPHDYFHGLLSASIAKQSQNAIGGTGSAATAFAF